MTALDDKVTTALNEARTLILGAEILLGFQFDAVFLPQFRALGSVAQHLDAVAYALMLVAVVLLLSPCSFHRLVEGGNDTGRLLRLTTACAAAALCPFAMCFGIDEFLVASKIMDAAIAAAAGCAVAACALIAWYGVELARRSRRAHVSTQEMEQVMPTPIKEKITTLSTEIRVILPGAQALLGFQFSAFLTNAFGKLPEVGKLIHFACLSSMAFAVVLLMAPAAYHRIAASGENSKDVDVFGTYAMLSAMVFLGLSMTGDFYLVVAMVTKSNLVGAISAMITLALAFTLWFGYPALMRWTGSGRTRAVG